MSMEHAADYHLDRMVVEFCRFARESGIAAGTRESLDALQAVQTVGIAGRETMKAALRSVLCSTKDHWDQFDEIFAAFWTGQKPAQQLVAEAKKSKPGSDHQAQEGSAMPLVGQSSAGRDDGGKAVLGATAQERLKKTDFSEVEYADQADLEQLSLRLLRQMSLRLSRRIRKIAAQGKLDLRRTIRQSVSRGGDPVELRFRRRKLQPLKLAILLDISGSMNPYSVFLVRFAYTLQKYFKHVDTFLFSTQLTEITPALRTHKLKDAFEALAQQSAGWSGGTKIGDSLRELSTRFGRRIFSRDTIFIVLSDGWDTGDPAVLAAELAAIHRRVCKLVWLNPLLGMADYQPVTRGMSAALPHIDVFAPAHNLESLLRLEMHLKRIT